MATSTITKKRNRRFIVSYKSCPESNVYLGFEIVRARDEAEAESLVKENYIREWYEGEDAGREYIRNWVFEAKECESRKRQDNKLK